MCQPKSGRDIAKNTPGNRQKSEVNRKQPETKSPDNQLFNKIASDCNSTGSVASS